MKTLEGIYKAACLRKQLSWTNNNSSQLSSTSYARPFAMLCDARHFPSLSFNPHNNEEECIITATLQNKKPRLWEVESLVKITQDSKLEKHLQNSCY